MCVYICTYLYVDTLIRGVFKQLVALFLVACIMPVSGAAEYGGCSALPITPLTMLPLYFLINNANVLLRLLHLYYLSHRTGRP